MNDNKLSICVVGGTGAQGSGLALRWAKAGHTVSVASRDEAKAKSAAQELNAILGSDRISGADYAKGAADASIIVLTVPFASQLSTVTALKDQLAGKILIDVTVYGLRRERRSSSPHYWTRCVGVPSRQSMPTSLSELKVAFRCLSILTSRSV